MSWRRRCPATTRSSSNAPAICGWAEGSRLCARSTWRARSTTGSSTRFSARTGGVATSGIGKRSWFGPDGTVAHHLLDPATGLPAYTGIVQVTALAPTAMAAEALSKAALLAGPAEADRVLVHGGVIVLDDGNYIVLDPGR